MLAPIKGVRIQHPDSHSILYTTTAKPNVTIVKRRTYKKIDSKESAGYYVYKPISLYMTNLQPNTTYRIKLWYGSNHRGRSNMPFFHPYNSIAECLWEEEFPIGGSEEENLAAQKRCTGKVLGLFNTYECNDTKKGMYPWPEGAVNLTNIFPNNASTSKEDIEKLRQYVLQTEWEFTTGQNQTSYEHTIFPAAWLPPMYRPGTRKVTDKKTGEEIEKQCYTMVGTSLKRSSHLSFKFSIEEISSSNDDIYFSDNTLVIGNKVDPTRKVPSYITIK